jgi:hypothetical protein
MLVLHVSMSIVHETGLTTTGSLRNIFSLDAESLPSVAEHYVDPIACEGFSLLLLVQLA